VPRFVSTFRSRSWKAERLARLAETTVVGSPSDICTCEQWQVVEVKREIRITVAMGQQRLALVWWILWINDRRGLIWFGSGDPPFVVLRRLDSKRFERNGWRGSAKPRRICRSLRALVAAGSAQNLSNQPTECTQKVTSRLSMRGDCRATLRELVATHPLVRRVLVFEPVGN
jgi:hypothetical protein